MGTPSNPDIQIQYYDSSVWNNLLAEAQEFEIRDAGILKIPQATIKLFTTTKYVTTSPILEKYKPIRIFADIRGTNDLLFYGRIYNRNIELMGGTNRKILTLTCRGLGQKLLQDTITWEYLKEQESYKPDSIWTFKTMIEDFLALPDSGYGTNITLETDSGAILDGIKGACNFNQQYLHDALRAVAETINYDGYLYIDASDNMKLHFVGVGTENVSPSVTLREPFAGFIYDDGIDDIKNYILIWGGSDAGIPTDGDRLTEKAVTKYSPAVWSAITSNTTITNETTTKKVGDYSVKVAQTSYIPIVMQAKCNLNNASLPQVKCASRCKYLSFWLYPTWSGNLPFNALGAALWVTLEDNAGNQMEHGCVHVEAGRLTASLVTDTWEQFMIPLKTLGITELKAPAFSPDGWYLKTGSSFNWDNIVAIYFEFGGYNMETAMFEAPSINKVGISGQDHAPVIYIDGLIFAGGIAIQPWTGYDSYCIVYDSTSMNNYGVRVYPHVDRDIASFEQTWDEGTRILNTLKQPVEKASIRLQEADTVTWAKHNKKLTLNVPSVGINSESWRITEIIYTWKAKGNNLRSRFELVKQNVLYPYARPRVSDVPYPYLSPYRDPYYR